MAEVVKSKSKLTDLVRSAIRLARADRPPPGVRCSLAGWPEARRQRMEAVLLQLQAVPREELALSSRDWAGTLWATARCRAKAPQPLLDAAVQAVQSPSQGAASSDAARCFWAAATLRWRQEEFLTGAKEMARPLLLQCSEQDLSNIAWASASLGFNPSGWISEVVGSYARQYSQTCSPQAVANLLWSLAKAFEGGFGDQAHDVAMQFDAAILSCLPSAQPQHVANILWSLAKLGVPLDAEGKLVESLSTRMSELLEDAEIQHLASGTWALAKLHGTKQATGRTLEFLRSLVDFLRKARVNKRSDSPWRVRFDGLFLSHISILCWSFARVMVKERVTRQLLRSASRQLDTFTDEGAIKAQEHANLLWAYAEACEKTWAGMQKPYAMLKRLVNLLCDPKLRLQGENATSFAAAVKALARLPIGASPQARQWMQAASVRQSKRAGHAELPPGEVVAMVRSLASCRSLHQRMMTSSLQFLQEDSRYQELQPAQLQMLLDALALLRPRKLAPEHLRFLQVVQGRLNDFPLPLLTSTLSRLQLLEGTEDVLIAASKRFEDAELHLPKQWWKGGQKEHGEEGTELSLWQWVRLVNSVEPTPCSAGSAPRTTEKLAKPFAAWLSGFLEDFNLETELLSAVLEEREDIKTSRELLQESAVARYRARLSALDSLGPRFTPFAAQLGLNFEANPPSDLQAKVWQQRREEAAALEGRLRFLPHGLPDAGGEQMAVLQHFAVANDGGAEPRGHGAVSGEESEEESEGEDSSEQVLLKRGMLLAASDATSKHADFKVLARLMQDLLERDKDGDVSGDVMICTDKAPCLSSLGAMKQFCHQWPKISLHVSYTGLEKSWSKEISSLLPVADPQGTVPPDGATPAALEEAVRRALSGRRAGQTVALLGTDPRVRELWKSVCATGVRPSGKNVPGKKREWQDKLKYFLAHRPHAFRLDDGEKLIVRLVENRDEESVAAFEDLRAAVEETILEFLRRGQTSRDHKGRGLRPSRVHPVAKATVRLLGPACLLLATQ